MLLLFFSHRLKFLSLLFFFFFLFLGLLFFFLFLFLIRVQRWAKAVFSGFLGILVITRRCRFALRDCQRGRWQIGWVFQATSSCFSIACCLLASLFLLVLLAELGHMRIFTPLALLSNSLAHRLCIWRFRPSFGFFLLSLGFFSSVYFLEFLWHLARISIYLFKPISMVSLCQLFCLSLLLSLFLALLCLSF